MPSYTLVLPFAYRLYYDECIATLKLPVIGGDMAYVLPVDNTIENRGVAESWNMGIDKLREINGQWLIVMSAAIRLGENGGIDIIEQLEKHPEAHMIHFARKEVLEQPFVRGKGPSYDEGNLGWHLTAIRRDVIEDVGYFDPNFTAGFEDLDYDLRVNKHYGDPKWLILPVDAHGTTMNHGIKLGGVKAPAEPAIAYFSTKWGVHPSALKQLGSYDYPFDNSHNDIKFFPPHRGRVWQWRET